MSALSMGGVSGAAAALNVTVQAKPAKAADAARQFEALLIGQMLRSAREESQDDDDDDASADSMFDMADQQFSQVLAKNGGLGMAHMIMQGLGPKGTNDENR